jgi:predicted AAA+ superfamily ATPase
MEIEEMNHWWTEKEVRPQLLPKTKRELFNAVKADVDRRQIQVIVGLRRVGKSTIFYQLIDYLIKKGVNPLNILYLTFDEPNLQDKRIGERKENTN